MIDRKSQRQRRLARTVRTFIEQFENRILMSAGLTGEYFNSTYSAGSNLTNLVVARTDAPTNFSFNWGTSAPATGVNPDTFSVRWEGTIKAPVAGTYTFYVDPDTNGNGGMGGEKLWIGSDLIINSTAGHNTEDSGTVAFSFNAGTSYNIKLEYYNYSGAAFTQLQYATTGLTKTVVPTAGTLNDLATTSSYTAVAANMTGPTATTFTGAPAGWSGADIGQPTLTGSSSYSGGVYSVTGGGTLYGGTNDQFQYAYQQVTGDFVFVGRLASMTDPNNGATAGLMLRTGLTASVPEVFIGSQPSGVPYDTRRVAAGAAESSENAGSGNTETFPYWLKIVRFGDAVTIYYAPDVSGAPGTWNEQNGQSLDNLPSTVYLGLAVGSRASTVCTATFDNVSVSTLSRSAETSYLANSFEGGYDHVMDDAATAFVDQAGNLYLDGVDENFSMSIYNPDGSLNTFGNNSHYEAGSAIATDTTFIYDAQTAAYTYQAAGVQAYNHFGFAVGTAFLGGDTINGMVTSGGYLYVASNNLIYKFSTSATATPSFVSAWEVDNAGNIAADPSGNLWIIQNVNGPTAAKVLHETSTGGSAGTSITFPTGTFNGQTVIPKGIAVDMRSGSTSGDVYITDVGNLQQVHEFNSSATYLSSFGVQYGAYGTANGSVSATTLIYPVGVGIDSSGDLYVVGAPPGEWGSGLGGGGGTFIKKFSSAGQLLWERDGLNYVNVTAPDPNSPTDVYNSLYHFKLNYDSTVPGTEATLVGVLTNPFAYPTDPRFVTSSTLSGEGKESARAGVVIRYANGTKFLYDFDQHASAVNVYRFLPNSQITVFCAELVHETDRANTGGDDAFYIWTDANGNGVKDSGEENYATGYQQNGAAHENVYEYVDSAGNIWIGGESNSGSDQGNQIREYLVNGVNSAGAPIYTNYTGTNTTYDKQWAAPSAITELDWALYDPSTDSMYLSGYGTGSLARQTGDDDYGTAGTILLKYAGWEGGNNGASAASSWQTKLPYTPDVTSDMAKPASIASLDFSGSYVFAAHVSAFMGVEVYSTADGTNTLTIPAGPEVTGSEALVDFRNGMNATKLSNGQYEIMVEEDNEGKTLLYRWTPGVTLPARNYTDLDLDNHPHGEPQGSASLDLPSQTWTVSGAGEFSPGLTYDYGNFDYTQLPDDGQVVAKITSQTYPVSNSARAGVMIRNSTASNAPMAAVLFKQGGTIEFQSRTTENGTLSYVQVTGQSLGDYLKVVRSGNSFSGYYSTNGTTWTQIGTAITINMASSALGGLAVSSHTATATSTATFTNVAVTNVLADTNIGSPGSTGTSSFDNYNNVWTVSGGGADIQGTSDQFNYDSESLSGDGSIVARVTSQTNTNVWAKAGVMIRNDTTAGSANVGVFITPGNGVTFQYRSSAGGSTTASTVSGLGTPQWVKVVRTGNVFTGFYSLDGVNWTQIGSAQTITMNTAITAGLAVTAHDNSTLSTATFDNVAITNSLALNATPSASSSLTTGGWGIAEAIDGQDSSLSGDLGWSSNNSLTTNHEEWLQMDLQSIQPVSQVVLYPRNDSGNVGYGFPINFTIQVSLDGTHWSTVSTQTSYAQPTTGAPQAFSFPLTSARYVKVDGTSLRSNPNDSGSYRMQFSEMQVF